MCYKQFTIIISLIQNYEPSNYNYKHACNKAPPRITAIVASTISVRIIPAFAGNTSRDLSFSSLKQDHPRIRGEHFP